MLEKLPLDNLLQILPYLEIEDLAAVDRSHRSLQFACAQIYLRDEKHQRLSLFLKSVNPTLRWGERWSSPTHISALRRAGNTNRERKNPFEVPKNERVEAEKKAKKKQAEKLLVDTLAERPRKKKELLYDLWHCKQDDTNGRDETILEVYQLMKEAVDEDNLSSEILLLLQDSGFYDDDSDEEEDGDGNEDSEEESDGNEDEDSDEDEESDGPENIFF
ncbi:conserved hypothetical protein [Lausannevirus]|uniref:F-box domain-containing protein n=1 Tax=Lausannevirus TaxID=999883 RepID=F2WLN3_9VIRU|nr:hypothetical protein LAU_0305 [Lausannevirus]AEA07156.1 conserved hypothetical protein [Lausannevirus]